MAKNGDAITLFLIEDDDIDAMAITRSFHKQKIANPIVRAYDGLQALEMMRANQVKHPYVVLLDLQMPRMGGLEFLAELRGDEGLANTVVFVLTTSQAEQDITASYDKNIAGYYIKDEMGEQFLNIVHAFDTYWRIVHLPNGRAE